MSDGSRLSFDLMAKMQELLLVRRITSTVLLIEDFSQGKPESQRTLSGRLDVRERSICVVSSPCSW